MSLKNLRLFDIHTYRQNCQLGFSSKMKVPQLGLARNLHSSLEPENSSSNPSLGDNHILITGSRLCPPPPPSTLLLVSPGLGRDWSPKFATGLNMIIGCSSKSISLIKLSFRQNVSLMRKLFWQNNSLVTHILFELQPIILFSPVTNFGDQSLASYVTL